MTELYRPTEAEIGWLAGIIDGEGTITLSRHKSKSKHIRQSNPDGVNYFPVVIIGNTDARIIEEVVRIAGCGTFHRASIANPKWTQMLRYEAACRKARHILQMVRPHLRSKGEQADIVLTLPSLKVYGDEYERRRALVEAAVSRIRWLNRRSARMGEAVDAVVVPIEAAS